jgi:hypothetical protein
VIDTGPTTTKSWLLWCLALRLLNAPKSQVDSLFAKRTPDEQYELQRRMDTIKRTRAIPVGEFLS